MAQDEPERDGEPEAEVAVLPAREAIALITPSPGTGFIPDLDAYPAASAEDRLTSEERSEHLENRDSASSET